jgi:hypothetical protein
MVVLDELKTPHVLHRRPYLPRQRRPPPHLFAWHHHPCRAIQLKREFALAGTLDILAQSGFVRCEYDDPFPAAGNRHIPLIAVRRDPVGGVGKQDRVNRLAL